MNYNLWLHAVAILFYVNACPSCIIGSGCEVHNDTNLLCNKYLNISQPSDTIRTIEICHVNRSELFLDAILRDFPNLTSLVVKYSFFKHIKGGKRLDEEYNNLEIIVFNNTGITQIDESIFSRFKNLKVLDLRNNSLQLIHSERIGHLGHIPVVYLSEGKKEDHEGVEKKKAMQKSGLREDRFRRDRA
ncbi:hypothetical protein Trydic_g23872 [Trypoxylus dichotomus]